MKYPYSNLLKIVGKFDLILNSCIEQINIRMNAFWFCINDARNK